jgi:hypothetical protein
MSRFWFANVAGLSPELVNQAILPTVLVAPVPFLSVLISWQRGILVHVKQTRYISHSVMISLGMLVVVLATATWLLPLPGVIISAAALIISVTAEWIYLSWRGRNAARTANLYPKQSEARAESGVRVL